MIINFSLSLIKNLETLVISVGIKIRDSCGGYTSVNIYHKYNMKQ